jgi:hypothetical protein
MRAICIVTLRISGFGFDFAFLRFAGVDEERGSDAIGCTTSIVWSLSAMPRRMADAPSFIAYIQGSICVVESMER